MEIHISASGLQKSFGNTKILHDINLTLRAGTVTALLGKSGSGKTTLLRALSLLELADAGELKILGNRFNFPISTDQDLPRIWPDVTVVFQDLFLWPHLTCGQNIYMAARLKGGDNGAAIADQVIRDLEIGALVNRYPTEASRGQRQLVAFARAVALDPTVLLCDEITASLDVGAAARVGKKIRELRDNGKTVLLITHQLSFARQRADHVVFIDGGTIAESGSPEIIDTPKTEAFSRFLEQASFAP